MFWKSFSIRGKIQKAYPDSWLLLSPPPHCYLHLLSFSPLSSSSLKFFISQTKYLLLFLLFYLLNIVFLEEVIFLSKLFPPKQTDNGIMVGQSQPPCSWIYIVPPKTRFRNKKEAPKSNYFSAGPWYVVAKGPSSRLLTSSCLSNYKGKFVKKNSTKREFIASVIEHLIRDPTKNKTSALSISHFSF